MKFNINLNFGGFYGSLHSDTIDSFVENEQEYFLEQSEGSDKYKKFLESKNLEFWELYDYKKTYVNYSVLYCNVLQEFINDEYDTELKIKFIELNSPKYYNYSTDTISAKIKVSKKDFKKLNKIFQDETEEIIKEITTSVDGYFAYYNFNDIIKPKTKEHKNVYCECLFDSIIKEQRDNIYYKINDSFYENPFDRLVQTETGTEFFNL